LHPLSNFDRINQQIGDSRSSLRRALVILKRPRKRQNNKGVNAC
jgi:hypothetical protein